LSNSTISRRYAKALVNLGAEQKTVEQFGEELAQICSVLKGEERLLLILECPTFATEKKAVILSEIYDTMKLSTGIRNFLGLLLTKNRLRYLSEIEGDYRRFADELSGVVRAQITSAAELNRNQWLEIQSGLEKQTGKKVELKVQLDPSLIGGIQAEIGGKVFDGSIKTQLKRIEDTLKKG
jgi:F-type H+-transporting ATPase subunit delta